MTSRPILFSAPMIKALLREQDPKTMTRRIVKPQPVGRVATLKASNGVTFLQGYDGNEGTPFKCPYGVPGDQLWCKENFAVQHAWNGRSPSAITPGVEVFYTADDRLLPNVAGRVRSSIHMPRWASRITLELTGVRVERVQDISEEDARAEGAPEAPGERLYPGTGAARRMSYRRGFENLWTEINGAESWRSNCFVWALTFRRVAQEATNAAR